MPFPPCCYSSRPVTWDFRLVTRSSRHGRPVVHIRNLRNCHSGATKWAAASDRGIELEEENPERKAATPPARSPAIPPTSTVTLPLGRVRVCGRSESLLGRRMPTSRCACGRPGRGSQPGGTVTGVGRLDRTALNVGEPGFVWRQTRECREDSDPQVSIIHGGARVVAVSPGRSQAARGPP